MARYIVRKLNLAQEEVRQKSLRILFEAYHGRDAELPSSVRGTASVRFPADTEFWGVFQGTGQIGFAAVTDLGNHRYRISNVAVDPLFRNRGAGRRLMHSILRNLLELGATDAVVQVEPGNKDQRKWFTSLGFSNQQKGPSDGISLVLTFDSLICEYLNLCEQLDRFANLTYGFYAVSEEPYDASYSCALVLMQNYRCSPDDADDSYHTLLVQERARMNQVLRFIANYLTDRGIRNLPLPYTGNNPDESAESKAAALKAGLGWLGKNDRVIHPVYGAKTIVCRIYCDARFPVNTLLRRSECGTCDRCVKVCPVKCLKNKNWSPNVTRKEVIDANACLDWRSRDYVQLGKYYECDACVKVCDGKKE